MSRGQYVAKLKAFLSLCNRSLSDILETDRSIPVFILGLHSKSNIVAVGRTDVVVLVHFKFLQWTQIQ